MKTSRDMNNTLIRAWLLPSQSVTIYHS